MTKVQTISRPAFRDALAITLAALALAGCAKSGSQAASANVAAAQAGGAAGAPATNAPVAANASSQSAAGVPSASGPPQTSPSSNASIVAIQFQRGGNCWKYWGVGSTFNGRFAGGQQVLISSTGEQAQAGGAGGDLVYQTLPRNVYIAGADGKLLTASSPGYFTIPASGAYQISYDPMSMIGGPGEMIVCTL